MNSTLAKGITSETYKGHKLSVRRTPKQWGYLTVKINHWSTNVLGLSTGDVDREMKSLRAYVDDALARPEAYHNGFGEYSFA